MQRNGESKLAADETTETKHHRSLISNYGIVKVKGSRLTKAGAAFVFFIFFLRTRRYVAITVPTVAARQFKLWGREIATPFLHYRCYISPRLPHTLLCCVSSQFATFFFFFLEQAVFHSSSHAGTHLSFFFFFSPRLILG